MFRKQDELLAPARMRAIQEELAAFFLDHVIAEDGDFYPLRNAGDAAAGDSGRSLSTFART